VRAVEYKSAVQTSWQAVLPVTQQQMEAYDELKWLESQIGNFGLLRDVIRDRLFFNDIAPDSEYNRKILARLFRKALDDLSELMGLKGEAKPARAKRDRYSDMAKRAA
jgi:hypothetical protein